jgi:hypothetical protein
MMQHLNVRTTETRGRGRREERGERDRLRETTKKGKRE